jgi:hypothetical protein
MRLLYELSKGRADLSRVYAKLDDDLAIVSEDVSFGTAYFHDSTPTHHLDLDLLRRAFKSFGEELERTTFWA